MGIIAVDKPATAGQGTRFSADECGEALVAIANGRGATDGVARKQKNAQQAAWDLRQGILEHYEVPSELLTSKTVGDDDEYEFIVYAKDLAAVQALLPHLVEELDEDEAGDEPTETDEQDDEPVLEQD